MSSDLKNPAFVAYNKTELILNNIMKSQLVDCNQYVINYFNLDFKDDTQGVFADFNFEVVLDMNCADYVPTYCVDTSDGTIEPSDVLLGQVGYAKGVRVVGTLDMSNYYTKEESDEKFVIQEANKGLSTNDYTTEDKDKLAGLENTEVINTLNSTSTTAALSAAKGKELEDNKADKTDVLELYQLIGTLNTNLENRLNGNTTS